VTRRWRPIERDLRATIGPHIAGVDEVGRGPLAGPVVACAVVMPHDLRAIPGIDDSKRLSADERVRLARLVRGRALGIGVGAASVREIDRFNIYHATVIAMRRALGRLLVTPDHVVVDGKAIRTLPVQHTAIVGGDGCCYSIACASIIAKVTRDRLMRALGVRYPNYGWDHNVGYSTPEHLRNIATWGITPHHRRSFVPVRQLSLGLEEFLPVTAEEAVLAQAIAQAEDGTEALTLEALVSDLAQPKSSASGISNDLTVVWPVDTDAEQDGHAGRFGSLGTTAREDSAPPH
jgi:ribonuclease HII